MIIVTSTVTVTNRNYTVIISNRLYTSSQRW